MPLFTYQFGIKQYFLVTECGCFRSFKLPLRSLINLIIKRLCSRSHRHFSSSGSQSLIKSATTNLCLPLVCRPQGSSHLVIYHMWLNHWTDPSTPTHIAPLSSSPGRRVARTADPGPLIGTRQLAADQSQPAPST